MKSTNNVLLLSPLPLPVGGIASWSLNLLQYAADSHQDNIVHLNTAVKYRSITQKHKGICIASGIIDSCRIIALTIGYCLKYMPKVVHVTTSASFGLFNNMIIGLICRIFRINYIVHFHFGRIPKLAIQQNWEWKTLVRVIRMSTVSIVIDSPSFVTLKAKKLDNVILVPNPCSTELEQLAHQKIKEYVPNEFIFVGHIIPAKGIFELIQAIIAIGQNINLTMVGPVEADIKKQLIELASKKDYGSWLRLVGVKSKTEILDMMQRSHVLLLPSYTESFPNVILEAMACGCPVIATDVGAIPDMLDIQTENPAGVCLPTRDINGLKEAIELLLKDSLKRHQMAQNGKMKVLSNYTMSHIFSKYKNLWSM